MAGTLGIFFKRAYKNIGQIGGGKERPSGAIDVAVMQSLNRKGRVKDVVANYGQVIVDECHHLPAFSFEGILKEVKARYVVGLTATPIRKDGHDPIITMQCGPIRWRMSATKQAVERPFRHMVYPRTTNFSVLTDSTEIGIQDVYALLTANNERNEMILEDVRTAVKAGRSPLVLTERTEHLEYLANRLEKIFKT